MTNEKLMTVAEVAADLKLGSSTIWRMVSEGSFPAPIKIGGSTRWNREELERYIARLTQEQRSEGESQNEKKM